MQGAIHQPHEADRLAVLESYEILDTPPDASFDRITRLAGALVGTPIALVALIDSKRLWFKSKIGLDASEKPREPAFWTQTILGGEMLVVEDASKDDRFAQYPVVAGEPNIRFFAGAPLMTKDGHGVGVLCVSDWIPRALSAVDRKMLEDLAAIVVDEMELHRSLRRLHQRGAELDRANDGLRVANQRLEALAATDPLTGISNRRTLDQHIEREVRRAARRRTPVALLLIDADNFKQYNDRYGHQAGDRCLQAIASVLKAVLHRPADIAARYGGEEFAILLPETDALGALQVAEMVREEIEALRLPHEGNPHEFVTVSVGACAIVPDIGDEQAALTVPADQALYRAKELGRNQVCATEQTALAARATSLPHVTRH